MKYRREVDSMGEVEVPAERLFGAQTARSVDNFDIGSDTMPGELIVSYLQLKKAAAAANQKLGKMSDDKASLIGEAVDILLEKDNLSEEFPAPLWQSGSGTQTNMNVNEVIANQAAVLKGEEPGNYEILHPNDDVNMSQSTNDTFPTVMSLTAVKLWHNNLKPVLDELIQELTKKSGDFEKEYKTGRTHLMDATPVSLAQEFASYHTQIKNSLASLERSVEDVKTVPVGGTATGTGLNSPAAFADTILDELEEITGIELKTAESKLAYQAAHDNLVEFSASLERLAVSLKKMAEDLRFMASGPRCGINEIELPATEPGSSIMPGKINPTQIEALAQVCIEVMSSHRAVALAGSQGQLELNTYRPLIVHNLIPPVRLLSDAISSFLDNCLRGLKVNSEVLEDNIRRSLMLVTALTSEIGYDDAARIAKRAREEGETLAESAENLNIMSAEDVHELLDVGQMVDPHS